MSPRQSSGGADPVRPQPKRPESEHPERVSTDSWHLDEMSEAKPPAREAPATKGPAKEVPAREPRAGGPAEPPTSGRPLRPLVGAVEQATAPAREDALERVDQGTNGDTDEHLRDAVEAARRAAEDRATAEILALEEDLEAERVKAAKSLEEVQRRLERAEEKAAATPAIEPDTRTDAAEWPRPPRAARPPPPQGRGRPRDGGPRGRADRRAR